MMNKATLERRQARLTMERNELMAIKRDDYDNWTDEMELELQDTIEVLRDVCEQLKKIYTAEAFIELGKEYGFSMVDRGEKVALRAKGYEGGYMDWLIYEVVRDAFTIKGNTDYMNIWLHGTRPDLTAEKLVEFNDRLNEIMQFGRKLELCEYVDPEDWQEIAGIQYAYEDARYRAPREYEIA